MTDHRQSQWVNTQKATEDMLSSFRETSHTVVETLMTIQEGFLKKEGTLPLTYPHTIEIVTTANKGTGIISRKHFRAGEKVFSFQGILVIQPKVYIKALQVDEKLFLESDGSFDENLNHSCDPNCYVTFGKYPGVINLNALKDIDCDEELTFNYNTTEWDLVEQQCMFACRCGASCCIGEIKGFKYLTVEQKLSIAPLLSPFLKRKLAAELGALVKA